MFSQLVPSLLQRCHCRENDDGVGDQLPFETRSVSPIAAVPLSAGLTVLVGPFAELTGSVGFDVAELRPSALIAVMTTRSAWPTSPVVGLYVFDVPAVMSPHARPSDAHRCHWYV